MLRLLNKSLSKRRAGPQKKCTPSITNRAVHLLSSTPDRLQPKVANTKPTSQFGTPTTMWMVPNGPCPFSSTASRNKCLSDAPVSHRSLKRPLLITPTPKQSPKLLASKPATPTSSTFAKLQVSSQSGMEAKPSQNGK